MSGIVADWWGCLNHICPCCSNSVVSSSWTWGFYYFDSSFIVKRSAHFMSCPRCHCIYVVLLLCLRGLGLKDFGWIIPNQLPRGKMLLLHVALFWRECLDSTLSTTIVLLNKAHVARPDIEATFVHGIVRTI